MGYVGFGNSKSGQLFRFSLLNPLTPVKGLICSSNYNPNNEEVFIQIDCNTIIRNNIKFDTSLIKLALIKCPSGCLNIMDF